MTNSNLLEFLEESLEVDHLIHETQAMNGEKAMGFIAGARFALQLAKAAVEREKIANSDRMELQL